MQGNSEMAIGRTEDRVSPWDPVAFEVTSHVWVPIRGYHLGQQSTRLHQQAGHMIASDPVARCSLSCKSGAVHIWVTAPMLVVVRASLAEGA